MHGTDEGIEISKTAATEVVAVESGSGFGTRLVLGDIRLLAEIDQVQSVVCRTGTTWIELVDGEDRIGASKPIGVVDIEHRGPGLAAAVHASDTLDVFLIDIEPIPVDVVASGHSARQADRGKIAFEEVAEVLGVVSGIVNVVLVFRRLRGKDGMRGVAEDLDAARGIADVGVSDGGTGLFIRLAETDLHLVASRGVALDVGVGAVDAADTEKVVGLRTGSSWQDHVEARITRVGRIEIVAVPGILVEGPDRGESTRIEEGCAGGHNQGDAVGVDQLDLGFESLARSIDVDPDL